jgi:hypothetical protein
MSSDVDEGTARSRVVRQLEELIEALDRRLPQLAREGESGITRDASGLKARALARLRELQRDP